VSCQPWAPSSGANAVHLRASAPRPGPSALGIRYEPPTLEPEPKDAEDAEGLSGGSKLGGYPLWIQGAETPDCADCGSRMALCCQLGDDDVGQNFGDCGVGYLFLCPRRCSGQFLSQSS
jgi:hypothetical protein